MEVVVVCVYVFLVLEILIYFCCLLFVGIFVVVVVGMLVGCVICVIFVFYM